MARFGSSGPPGGRARGALLLALLLVLSVAAFAGTRELRSEPDIVNSVVVTPAIDASAAEPASIRFELTRADGDADVLILDDAGEPVRTLAEDVLLEAGSQRYSWNGRDDEGEPVPVGEYRIRVVLGEQGREIEPPGTIEVGG